MKKIILTMVTLCLVLSMAACGKEDTSTNDDNEAVKEDNVVVQTEETDTDASEEELADKMELLYTFKDPSNPVAFDYPNLQLIREGTSRVFMNNKYVIIYCRDAMDAELKDIPTVLSEKFYNVTDIYLPASFDSFLIESTEELTINDQTVLKLQGSVVVKYYDDSKEDYPMRGYTFAKEGFIYELIAVLCEEPDDTNQAEMEDTIDAMISTLRDDR